MIGRVNTGGGTGATLTVTAPAGVTVTVTKDGKTKTKVADSSGLAVFKGLATGAWTLTITDGSQISTKTVSVTADYSTVLAFFSATINITYPAGSTCTCSDGTTTFTAPDTSGTWVCIVPKAGTWTVSCSNGTQSDSENVSITTDGQSKSIALSYYTTVFDRETQSFSDIESNIHVVDDSTHSPITDKTTHIQFKAEGDYPRAWQWETKIDFSKYDKLEVVGYSSRGTFGIADSLISGLNFTDVYKIASKQFTSSESVLELDISSINTSGYIGIYANNKTSVFVKRIRLY